MPKPTPKRRQLTFQSLGDAVTETERLLQSGYERGGNWSLGQICYHLRTTQDCSVDGYPKWMSLFAPIRPIFRRLMLPRVLNGTSPAGVKTASVFIPPNELEDALEVEAFAESVRRVLEHEGDYYPHPGFGHFDRKGLEELHAAHASHHLGFLHDQSSS